MKWEHLTILGLLVKRLSYPQQKFGNLQFSSDWLGIQCQLHFKKKEQPPGPTIKNIGKYLNMRVGLGVPTPTKNSKMECRAQSTV